MRELANFKFRRGLLQFDDEYIDSLVSLRVRAQSIQPVRDPGKPLPVLGHSTDGVLRKEVGIASCAEGVGEPPQGAIRHVANDFVYQRRVECGGSIRRGRGRDKERRRVVRVVVVPRHVSFAHLRAARRRQRARPESNGIRRGKLALADLGEAGEVEPRVVAGDAMASAIGAAVVHRGRAWLPKVMLARYPYAVPGRAGGDRDVKEAAQRHIAFVDGVTRVVARRAGRSPIANHLRGLGVVGGAGIEREVVRHCPHASPLKARGRKSGAYDGVAQWVVAAVEGTSTREQDPVIADWMFGASSGTRTAY